MGTRSGDLDPSILVFLARAGWNAEDLDSMLNRESGLKGLAGNNDMRSVVEASEAGDAKAATALAVDLLPAGQVHRRLPCGRGRREGAGVHRRDRRELASVPCAGGGAARRPGH